MSFTGTLVIESFRYGKAVLELPVVKDGLPTGATVERHVLTFQAVDSDVAVEVRIAPEDWDNFIAFITKKPVIAATEEDLRQLGKRNGGT